MGISGISMNPDIASIYNTQTLAQVQPVTQETESDRDSYISTMTNISEAIPSGTYNASGRIVGETEESQMSGSDAGTSEGSGVGSAGGAGGSGGGSDSGDETSTSIVTINGRTYLETTTTDENGNTTVTRTLIGAAPVEDKGQEVTTGPSEAAQALAAM